MSELHTIATAKLDSKRAPSHALIMRIAGVYLAAGHKAIDLEWQGQTIELTYSSARRTWYGAGSINQDSGQNIAAELNDIAAFIVDHFKILAIK